VGARRAIDWLREPATVKLLRVEAMTVTVVGLTFFFAAAIIAPLLSWSSPELVWKTGLVMTAVGCLWLVGLMVLVYPKKGRRLTGETVLGFLGVLVGFISLLVSFGDEQSGIQAFWVVMTVFLLPSGWAIVVLAALANRREPFQKRR
jgi:hypothetical protein